MVSIPDNYQPFGAGYVPVYDESERLVKLREREKRLRALEIGSATVGPAFIGLFGSLVAGVGLFGARKRTRDAIKRREAEERAAALEAARVRAYEARYGKFDVLSASLNAQRHNAVSLMEVLSRSQR